MTISIRRIFPDDDFALYMNAHLWEHSYPQWYREMMPRQTFREMLQCAQGLDQCDVGIFNGTMFALATLSLRSKGVFEVHLTAKRGTRPELLREGLEGLKECVYRDLNPKELYMWVARRNKPIRKLCISMGFREQGEVRTHGSYHGKPIEWVLYSEQENTGNKSSRIGDSPIEVH